MVALQTYKPEDEDWNKAALSMVVVGASGDLAKKKIYPALFALYVEGHMPEYFTIWGFARSKMTNEEFREYIGTSLSCRLTDKGNCAEKFDTFLERCFYHPGQYSNRDDFAALSEKMKEPEQVGFSLCTLPPTAALFVIFKTCQCCLLSSKQASKAAGCLILFFYINSQTHALHHA